MILGSKSSLNKKLAFCLILIAVLFGWGNGAMVSAQETTGSWLFLSKADASSAPTITLRAYGIDTQGAPLNLTPESLVVTNNGLGITNLVNGGPEAVGTFTVFVIDIPPGVEAQIPAVQQAIEQFASPPNMQERLDHVAVYRVGETDAIQLLEPTNFYNTVRNFFATPLEPESGPTALYDSLIGLVNNLDSLKPEPNMYTSIVVLTDGTDVVSTKFEESDVALQASAARVPIHTISLNNVNLQPAGQETGQTFLAELASGSRGVSAALDEPTNVQGIWDRISSFRNHSLFQYTIEEITAGEQQVGLSLANEPAELIQTTVTVSAAAPSVVINLPEESRTLTLVDLETPVQLSFSASASWLDGIQRQLTNAELIVNGTVVQSIDVTQLNRFSAQISNFVYGQNTVQIAVTDEQGQQATSPAVILTINEGEENSVPEDIQGAGSGSNILRIVLGCFIALVVLLLLALVAVGARRSGLLGRIGLAGPLSRLPFIGSFFADGAEGQGSDRQPEQSQREFERYTPDNAQDGWEQDDWQQPQDYGQQQQDWDQAGGWGQPPVQAPTPWPAVQPPPMNQAAGPYLEILESVTRMPALVDLTAVEHRLGRSPGQADIVFENDITVSRLHASIVLEESGYKIYDEGSTSGTWVNEQAVAQRGHSLRDGDEIRLGAAVMRFRSP